LSLASLSGLVLHLPVRPGAFPSGEHLNGAPLGLSLALLANIRLGWKGLFGLFICDEEK